MIFGHNGMWVTSTNASGVGTNVSGVKLIGDSGSYSGFSVSNGGDVNADSIDDFIIGGYFASPHGRVYAGRAWIVFGRNKMRNWTGMVNLTTLTLPDGVVIDGAIADDHFGYSVSGKVDVNHDGISDLIIGSPFASPNSKSSAGTTTVIFGRKTWKGEIDTLTDINGTNGFKLLGEDSGDRSGHSVSFAGDVNSDGIQDFIIGAFQWNKNNTMTFVGRSYVVFGKAGGGWPAMMNLSTIDGNNGFTLDGSVSGEHSGVSGSNAGDVNNDGKDDLITWCSLLEFRHRKSICCAWTITSVQ